MSERVSAEIASARHHAVVTWCGCSTGWLVSRRRGPWSNALRDEHLPAYQPFSIDASAIARAFVVTYRWLRGGPSLRDAALLRVRLSKAQACTRVRQVDPRGAALRYTWESDEEHIRDRAGVDDVIDFARALYERLPRGVACCLALAANRSVNREVALLYDDYRTPWMRVTAGGAAGNDSDLRHDNVRSLLKRDGPR